MGRTLRSPGHLTLMAASKQARLDAGLTQTELADRLERPQSFVAKYENGERKVEVVFASQGNAIAENAIRRIAALYAVEKDARGKSSAARRR